MTILSDFKDSPSEQLISYSAAERLAWAQCIEQASSYNLDLIIRHLKEQIRKSQVPRGTGNTMGNHIDLGMPMMLPIEPAPVQQQQQPAEEAPFEGDLIQF